MVEAVGLKVQLKYTFKITIFCEYVKIWGQLHEKIDILSITA